jgi:hypothetical protein
VTGGNQTRRGGRRAGAGRPPALTVEQAEQLIAITRCGIPLVQACRAARVSRSTVRDAMRRGHEPTAGDVDRRLYLGVELARLQASSVLAAAELAAPASSRRAWTDATDEWSVPARVIIGGR